MKLEKTLNDVKKNVDLDNMATQPILRRDIAVDEEGDFVGTNMLIMNLRLFLDWKTETGSVSKSKQFSAHDWKTLEVPVKYFDKVRNSCLEKIDVKGNKLALNKAKWHVEAQRLIDLDYEYKKDYFEKFHFKVIQLLGIVRVRLGDSILEDLETFSISALKNLYCNLKIYKFKKDSIVKDYFTRQWQEDIDMRQYNYFEFEPPKRVSIDDYYEHTGDERHQEQTYNLYNGFKLEKDLNFRVFTEEEKEYMKNLTREDSKLLEHCYNLMGADDECYEYFLDWLAHLMQYRRMLPDVAIVIISKQGLGKGSFAKLMNRIMGERYIRKSAEMGKMMDKHSNFLCNRFLVIFEEMKGADGFKHYSNLKSLITDKAQVLNLKNKPICNITHCVRFLCFSNSGSAVVKVGENDRKYYIVEGNNAIIEKKGYFTDLHKNIDDDKKVIEFWGFLMQRDLTDRLEKTFKVRPKTEIYKDIKMSSISNILKFTLNILMSEEGKGIRYKDGKEWVSKRLRANKLYESYKDWCSFSTYTPYNPVAFGRGLIEYKGVSKKRTNKGNVYYIDFETMKKSINEVYERDMFCYDDDVRDSEDDSGSLDSDVEEVVKVNSKGWFGN